MSVGGRGRIRTSVGYAGDFTDRSLWPLGHPPGSTREDSIPFGWVRLTGYYPRMAKDQFSFDIVSQVDPQEVRNALDQAEREIITRFDFKNTGTSVSQDNDLIELRSGTENRLKAALEVLKEKMIRRQISLKALREGPVLAAAKGTVRQTVHVNRGINEEKAREITKFIKKSGLKVQTQVQGDQLRVTAKKKDDLQAVIQALKAEDFEIPLQFTNYRP